MHGLIHLELQKFVSESFGQAAWTKVKEKAGVGAEVYTPLATYPDEQMAALVKEGCNATGLSAAEMLERFGEFLVPAYLSLYGSLLSPSWRTLDVLENTEETIHRVVRMRHPGAEPPRLHMERTFPDEVVLTYDSPRRLCAVAKGIARGVAKHFLEGLEIDERTCMLKGDALCVIAFRRRRAGRPSLPQGAE